MKQRLYIAAPGDTYYVKDEKILKELVDTGNFIQKKIYYTSKQ